ncbi:MAG TPA: tetratricopeptide repeat protein [Candidatus Kryptonia bacterium]
MRRFLVPAMVFGLMVAPGFAQNPDEMNNFRIAQALEQSGEYQKALGFYKQLYQLNPSNIMYFDGLRRTYMSLKLYPDAERLVMERIESDSTNIVLVCELADAYYKGGSPDSAFIFWNKALALNPDNPATYRAVAGFLINNRLFDRAIDVYRKGDALPSSNGSFISDIARLYFLNMNYGESVKELMKLLTIQNQNFAITYIEQQLGAYASSKQALGEIIAQMETEVKQSPGNVDYRRILAFLYMETKDYSSAYKSYKWLDEHSDIPGSELMAFADRAYNDEAFEVAANAYDEVSMLIHATPAKAQAIMGYGNSLLRMGELHASDESIPCPAEDSLTELRNALSAFGRVINEFPSSPFMSEAVLRSIEIMISYFDDFPGAETMFSKYGGILKATDSDGVLLRIRLSMAEGKFAEALDTALGSIQSCKGVSNEICDRLRYESALALYFMGMYDSSKYYLGTITANPKSDAANESIQLLDLIVNNIGSPAVLKEFASANSMETSDRVAEALEVYQQILKEYPQAPLADNARLALATDYCKLGKPAEALKYLAILAEDSTGIFADRAQFNTGRIYELTLHDKQKAISVYENFLIRFPNSIYQDKVRSIIAEMSNGNS